MARIKVNSSELESAYRHSKTLVSKCEDVGSMVRSVINGMDDSSFSAKAGIMSNLHNINTRLNKQAELMRQYGAIIRTIEDEMQSADSSFGVSSNSIWGGVGRWVGSTAKKILPFSTSSVLGKQNKTASVFLATSSAAIATSVGKIIRDWLKQIFGRIFHNGESSGGTSESTGGASSVTHSGFTNSGTSKNPSFDLSAYSYHQDDKRWSDYVYDGTATIGETGCLVTAISMVESKYQGKEFFPGKEIIDELHMTFNGYGALNSVKSYKSESDVSLENIYEHLKSGPVIIGGKQDGGATHYMVISGYKGDGINLKAEDFLLQDNSGWNGQISDLDSFMNKDRIWDGFNNKWPTLTQMWYRNQ